MAPVGFGMSSLEKVAHDVCDSNISDQSFQLLMLSHHNHLQRKLCKFASQLQ